MPTGKVTWYDPHSGKGGVERSGFEYPVAEADIDTHARVPGARVHFDIERHRDGDRAVNVILHRGTRTSPRQRRFGDAGSAKSPEDKGGAPSSKAARDPRRSMQRRARGRGPS